MVGSKQRGFTLIELVVVIVILGILAAFAVPKFMGLETQARVATVNAMAGTLRSSAAMARGVWMAQGATGTTITVEGSTVNMTSGYPNRTTLNLLVQDTSGFTYTPANGRWVPVGARTANCYVQYNNAPANGVYSLTYGTTGTTAAIQTYLRANC